MKYFICFFGMVLITYASSGQKIITSVIKDYGTIDYRSNVSVIDTDGPVPLQAELIGQVKVEGDQKTGMCDLESVIGTAAQEARKIGGNTIKLIRKLNPDVSYSCYRILVSIYKTEEKPDTISGMPGNELSPEYAMLNIYWLNELPASLAGNELWLGNSKLNCSYEHNCERIKITREGPDTIWLLPFQKVLLPLNIKFNHEYYIRCRSVNATADSQMVECVDSKTGKWEFSALKKYKPVKIDQIILDNGTKVNCNIIGEDRDNYIISYIYPGGKSVKLTIAKNSIKQIDRF